MKTQAPLYNNHGRLIGHLVTTYTPVSPPRVVAQTPRQSRPEPPAQKNGYQQLMAIVEEALQHRYAAQLAHAAAMPPLAPRTLELVVERQRVLGLRP